MKTHTQRRPRSTSTSLFLTLALIVSLSGMIQAADKLGDNRAELTKQDQQDQQALAVGRAVLKLNELAGAGAPLMSAAQLSELERDVKFLSETKSNRMIWAWLEFRIRADSQLQLQDNPHADAIKQRLKIFKKLLRRYFVLE